MVFSRANVIEVEDLPAVIRSRGPSLEEGLFTDLPSLDELERRYLIHVLKTVDGNAAAPPRSWVLIAGRSTGWPSASGSI